MSWMGIDGVLWNVVFLLMMGVILARKLGG
jgi:hypothetical protein